MSDPAPLGFFVKLLVLDRNASAEFYEKLGFVRVGADSTFIHLRWEEKGDVMIVSAPTGVRVDGKRGWGILLSFTSQTALETLAERARALSAPCEGPDVKPWHTRELVVTDPDGYRLNFVAPT
jgi:predicted lactoylglutathione lyase